MVIHDVNEGFLCNNNSEIMPCKTRLSIAARTGEKLFKTNLRVR